MNIQHENLQIEMARLNDLTISGKIRWEKKHGTLFTYHTNDLQQFMAVSCCSPDCWLQVGNRKWNIPCEDMLILCAEIAKQIKKDTSEMSAVVETLRTVIDQLV